MHHGATVPALYPQAGFPPWEELRADRERCPVAYSPHLDAVQVSSYAAIREVMEKLPHSFTGNYSTLYPREQPLPEEEQVFAAADPPRHTRQRRLFVKAMSASRIEHMRPFSERLADELIDAIVAKGDTFDLAGAYARKVSEGTSPNCWGGYRRRTVSASSTCRPCSS